MQPSRLLPLIVLLCSSCASATSAAPPANAPADEEFAGFAGEDELSAREAERAGAREGDDASGRPAEVECMLKVDGSGCRSPGADAPE